MGLRTALALAGAALALLVLGAVARSLARRRGWGALRTSAGVLLVAAVPVGLAAAATITDQAAAISGGALLVAAYGLLRDRLDLPRWCTPAVVAIAAVLVVQSGLRFGLGGVDAVDVGWTVLWILAVTLSLSALGSADGLIPSVGAAVAAAAVGIAAFAHQGSAGTLLGALLGALCGFLAYNVRPASLYLGNAGGLFTGFVLGAGALWVHPTITRPGSLVVSLLLVGVPLVDGLVVVCGRLRRGHPISLRVRDHLVHRLVGGGLTPARAITFLVLVQVALGVLAIFVARGVLAPWIAVVAGVVVLWILVAVSMRAKLRDGGARSHRLGLLVVAVVGFAVLATIPAVLAAFASRDHITAGRAAATAALRAARAGSTDKAATLFATAEHEFQAADDRLDSPLTAPSLVVPLVGSNVDAARHLARIGLDLSRAGKDLAQEIDPNALRVVNGRVPLEAVASALPHVETASRVLAGTKADLDAIDTSFLVSEVDDTVSKLDENLTKAATDASHATEAARIADLVLGKDQTRRYLLVVQNPAELRGTGGLVGNWGILSATDGKVHLDDLQRIATLNAAGDPSKRVLNAPKDFVDRYARFDPARTFQNVNISPDFPTVAGVMADQYAQTFFPDHVDGVVAVDPTGLAALLQLTGPVKVEGWPVPVSAQNVVDVTLRDAYQRFARTPERADFLGDVARAAIDKATNGSLGTPATVGRVLGQAAHDGHISIWFAKPGEERVGGVLGVSGRVPSTTGDSLVVSNTNAGGNKLDYYLQRTIDYSVTVTPTADLRDGFTKGTVTVGLANQVPPTGIAQIAAGPFEGATDQFVYGQNHTFLSVYTPLTYTAVRVNDQPATLEPSQELGRNVYSSYLDVFSQGSVKTAIDLAGNVQLRKGGWYDLTIMRQATLHEDKVAVHVAAPSGFEIVRAVGLKVHGGVAEGTVPLDRTRTVRVQLAHSGSANLWDRLRNGS